MMRQGLALASAFVAVGMLAWAGIPEWLGAHPYWAVRIGWTGGAVGVVLVAVMIAFRVTATTRIGIGLAGLGLAFAVARIGAARFAASYAEDALAGRMWFFGWITVAAALTLVLQALAVWRRR